MTTPNCSASAAALRLFYRLSILQRELPAAAADREHVQLFRIIHNLSSAVINEGLDLEELKQRYEAMCVSDFGSSAIREDLLSLRQVLEDKVPAPILS